MPNGPVQDLRQDHLGRLRPARQPGPCRYPSIQTLPRTPQGGTPTERLPRQALRAPLTAASPQRYGREPLREPRTSAEPCVPSRHHHPCQSPAGRPRPAHCRHSPRWPASTRCSRASPASVSAHSSSDDSGSGGCGVRQTDHHRLGPRHRTDARVRCPTTGRGPSPPPTLSQEPQQEGQLPALQVTLLDVRARHAGTGASARGEPRARRPRR